MVTVPVSLLLTSHHLQSMQFSWQNCSRVNCEASCTGFALLQALLRVEGLVRGGAAGLDGFLEMLKPLRQPLTVQLNDRYVRTTSNF